MMDSARRPVRRILPCVVVCASALAGGCGGTATETSVIGPDQGRCQITVSAQPPSVPAGGGAVALSISSARDCTWNAATDAAWIQLNPASGQGSGQITAMVAPNEQPAVRAGAVAVNQERVTISQEPRPCRYELRDASSRLGADGGRGSAEVATEDGCPWTAASSAEWLRVLTGSGDGTGRVEFEAAANSGDERRAVLTVAGERLEIAQAASNAHRQAQCTFTVSPPSQQIGASGGEGRAYVGTQEGCEWSASADASWIAVSGGRRTGSGEVGYTVQTNPTASERTGTITAGGQSHSVTQAAGVRACDYAIQPASRHFPAAGGRASFHVQSQAACNWIPVSGASWVAVTSGPGRGDADVGYTVAPNTSASARSTAVNVGGQVHTITQSGAAAALRP